jgi:molybdate transport system regulatory protein
MKTSARNFIRCRVKEIHQGIVSAEVVLELPDGQRIVSIVTKNSVEELGLAPGTPVNAIVKATSVFIGAAD